MRRKQQQNSLFYSASTPATTKIIQTRCPSSRKRPPLIKNAAPEQQQQPLHAPVAILSTTDSFELLHMNPVHDNDDEGTIVLPFSQWRRHGTKKLTNPIDDRETNESVPPLSSCASSYSSTASSLASTSQSSWHTRWFGSRSSRQRRRRRRQFLQQFRQDSSIMDGAESAVSDSSITTRTTRNSNDAQGRDPDPKQGGRTETGEPWQSSPRRSWWNRRSCGNKKRNSHSSSSQSWSTRMEQDREDENKGEGRIMDQNWDKDPFVSLLIIPQHDDGHDYDCLWTWTDSMCGDSLHGNDQDDMNTICPLYLQQQQQEPERHNTLEEHTSGNMTQLETPSTVNE